MSDFPKLCPDCIHFAESMIAPTEHFAIGLHGAQAVGGYVFRRCTHPRSIAANTDAVATGVPPDTRDARDRVLGVCGLEGVLFEQRSPKVPPPPVPPPCREICTACGLLPPSGRHNSWICRLVIWLDPRHPEHKRLTGEQLRDRMPK